MENLNSTPNNNLSKNDITMLREKFITDYSKQKGWDVNKLSTTQLLEIVEQPRYKRPGMILS